MFNQMPKAHAGGWAAKENLEFPPVGKSKIDESELVEEAPSPKPKLEIAAEMGFNKNQVSQFQKLADNPDAVQKAIDDAQDNDAFLFHGNSLKRAKR